MEFARLARTALGLAVVATTAAVACLATAAPASAVTADVTAACGADGAVLSVVLRGYGRVKNTVKVQDGTFVLESREFSQEYLGTFPRPADVPHTFLVTFRAPDNVRLSFVREVKTAACATPPPPSPPPAPVTTTTAASPTTTTTTTTTTTASSSTASSGPESTSSTPPTTNTGIIPLGSKSDLSGPSASVAIPLLLGLCLVSAVVVILFTGRRRRRAD